MDTTNFYHDENKDINFTKNNLKVMVIFPAKNEEGTIENTVSMASRSNYNPEIIVVDAYSNDKTAELATRAGATVIQQPEQIFPGKGIAMKVGIREAITRSADIILFLDADIKNLSPQWINSLVSAVLVDNCDMARGFYERHARDAAVTKLIARPLLNIFFPELSHFEQPLSGEVCARRQLWQRLLEIPDSPNGWGIDVWFLIEIAMLGCSIREVFMGTKDHTSFEDYKEDISKLTKMAEQVEFTIIREAIKYGRLQLQNNVSI
jgi:glycosyltransferase involved in cell wall biosynthesis